MPSKRTSGKAKAKQVSGQARKPSKSLQAGLYARVSTLDQPTLTSQYANAIPLRGQIFT
jgi:hypothetical protein